jgi:signal transduction histidine kinase
MKQVFLNLFNNAIEAMPQGGELFVITTYQDNDIKIEIIDTGCGILPENTKKLFKPFFTTKEEGTGLGLSICKRIIENHKGSISVDSNPGKGSTFTIHLPVLI